jgi:serine/threonine protein kinase
MHLPEGYFVKNRYRIDSILGQGGFGITYLAHDMELDRRIALKELFISGNSMRSPDQTVISMSLDGIPFSAFVDRFMREARQIAQFNHQNIIKVYEFFEANGTAYFAMEYINGMSLQELVRINGPLQGNLAVEVMNSLMAAVSELHAKDVVHRDIKPANVMISDQWRVVLIDFGTARSFDGGRTISTVAMVSSGYSPWEQYGESGELTQQSDIYAIGATMYYLLTGQKPLAAPDRMGANIQTPKQLNPSLSNSISQAVMKAMALMPHERFGTIQEFQQALSAMEPTPKPKYKKESYFNGYGRIARSTYFGRSLPLALLIILLDFYFDDMPHNDDYIILALILLGCSIVLLLFQLAKRLQDCGVHGVVALSGIIPYVGVVLFLLMLFVPGQKRSNAFGLPLD